MLTDFVKVHFTDPGDPHSVFCGGVWLSKIADPPRTDRENFLMVKLLFGTPDHLLMSDEKVSLCMECRCDRKRSSVVELPSCVRYAYGLCVDATLAANDGAPLTMQTIGTFAGFSKQRIDALVLEAQKELIRKVLEDAELADFVSSLGLSRNAQ